MPLEPQDITVVIPAHNARSTIRRALEGVANQVIADNTKAAADFKEGKEEALKFLIGKMMAITKGKANPKLAADLLRKAVGGA